jgi:two-component sensor histidine kinase
VNSERASRSAGSHDDLLLRETHHRCTNDLQLVMGMLSLQSRKATSKEVREALANATARVAVLARSRVELDRPGQPSLRTALQQVCDALDSQAEPRSISISAEVAPDLQGLGATQVTTLALAVNELATNAIKHAFREDRTGHIRITARLDRARHVVIIVDDDGLPFAEAVSAGKSGLGLTLVRRLVESINGTFVPPPQNGPKCFEIRVPF